MIMAASGMMARSGQVRTPPTWESMPPTNSVSGGRIPIHMGVGPSMRPRIRAAPTTPSLSLGSVANSQSFVRLPGEWRSCSKMGASHTSTDNPTAMASVLARSRARPRSTRSRQSCQRLTITATPPRASTGGSRPRWFWAMSDPTITNHSQPTRSLRQASTNAATSPGTSVRFRNGFHGCTIASSWLTTEVLASTRAVAIIRRLPPQRRASHNDRALPTACHKRVANNSPRAPPPTTFQGSHMSQNIAGPGWLQPNRE